jgi:hypothetical protein
MIKNFSESLSKDAFREAAIQARFFVFQELCNTINTSQLALFCTVSQGGTAATSVFALPST